MMSHQLRRNRALTKNLTRLAGELAKLWRRLDGADTANLCVVLGRLHELEDKYKRGRGFAAGLVSQETAAAVNEATAPV